MVVRHYATAALAAVQFLIAWPVLADCRATQDRPSIGLALSGGGARGAAHVGVIRELEILGVPVDCIAGTSMGAIVGGLYASGMTAAEIESFMLTIDWQDALSDQPPREDLSFRRKQDDRGFLIDFKLGLRDGNLALPKGLLQGQKQNLLLKSATLPVSGIHDFDRLPIPFRAMATDIESGASVAQGRGNLAAAIQASMSVPGVFAPREIGGRLLVDGGITNNLPVDIVRTMGADVVIAVDVSEPLMPRSELGSGFAIANQMLTILMQQRTALARDSLGAGDVLIQPSLGRMPSGSFAQLKSVIDAGRTASLAVEQQLRVYALSAGAYAQHLEQRRRSRPGNPVVDHVTVVSNSRLAPEAIERRLRATPGEPLNQKTLEQDISRIYGLDTFEQVDYEIVTEGDRTELEVRAQAKSWGPSFLDFGMSLEEDFEGSSDYTIAARYTRAEINHLGAEWRIDMQLGQNARLLTEFYQPLDIGTRYFVAPQLELTRSNVTVFDGNQRTSEYRVSTSEARFDLGRNIFNWGELRFGFRRARGRAEPRIGEVTLPTFEFDSGGWSAAFAVDLLDNPGFPRTGQLGRLSWQAERESLGADLDSDILRLSWLGARSFGDHTLLGGIRFASAIDDQLALQDTFNLGGLFRLSGYSTDELAGRQLGLATLVYYQRLAVARLAALDLPVYAGASFEAGNVWDDRDQVGLDDLRFGGSLFMGIDTILGPLYLAVGIADDGHRAGYFYLGQTF